MRHALLSSFVALLLLAGPALAETPIVTDSRIKTFVYNENEVFTITTHYGYQSNIEFGPKETIDTVSVGDRVAWQIIPAGRRLFIRSQEENAHTNMTIVTNLHAYQFDLRSSAADAVFGSEELTYVVRFFYPGDMANNYQPMTPPAMPGTAPLAASPVSYSAPASPYTPPAAAAPAATGPLNYKYTYSGNSSTAPVKIYDDGHSTYFKYRSSVMPQAAVITARGEQLTVPVRRVDANTVAVDIVAPRFSLNQPGGQVIVYNESSGA